jgi:hypothetical protein
MSVTFSSNGIGIVPKDGAFSNLYGAHMSAAEGVIAGKANFKTLEVASSTIENVTTTAINGSSASISLLNCNPNELLATNASLLFVSIPYTSSLVLNSVPLRSSQFTMFSKLTLTDSTEQITANISPNQVIIDVPTPASSRVYSFQLEGPSGGSSLAVTSTALTTGFGFLDYSILVTQMATKSATGNAIFTIDSGAGANSLIQTQSDAGALWSLGNYQSDNTFRFNYDFIPNNDYINVADNGGASAIFTVKGNILPSEVTGLNLGSSSLRWDSFCVATGGNTSTNLIAFTGTNIAASGMRTIAVNNTIVTASSIILAVVESFTGTYFTDGCPYATVSDITGGSFNLNVFNCDIDGIIPSGETVSVRYWVVA